MLGRRDLRRLPALSERRSVGAPAQAAQGPAQHQAADALPRPEHPRLQALRRRRGGGVRAPVDQERHRHHPHLRRPQRRAQPRNGHQGHQEVRRHLRSGDELHRQPRAYRGLLRKARAADRGTGRGHHLHQGHGQPASALQGVQPGQAPQGERQDPHPPAHPQHLRHRRHDAAQGHRGRRGHRRYRPLPAGQRHFSAGHRAAGRHPAGHGVRYRPGPQPHVPGGGAFPQGRR